jgi:hypothetical protein
VKWDSYHVHTPTHVRKLYTFINYTYTWTSLHVSRINRHPQADVNPQTFSHGATAPSGPGAAHYRGFTITLRHSKLSKTPLDESSALRRQHTTFSQEPSMPPAEFEPAIAVVERPQTYALDCAAVGFSPLYWRLPEDVVLLLQHVGEFIFSTDNS